MKLGIAVPALNEEVNIESIIERSPAAGQYIKDNSSVTQVEVAVVSNGSTGRTIERDAIPLSIPEARRLVRAGGFTRPVASWSLFYFPRPLAFLRGTERFLSHLPLGAQYCVLAVK
jgi:hypothetical protein